MKNIKKITFLGTLSSLCFINVACATNQQTTISKEAEVTKIDYNFDDESKTQIILTITNISTFKNLNDVQLEVSNIEGIKTISNGIFISKNKILFNFNDLVNNVEYQIQSLTINNNAIYFSNKVSNKSFIAKLKKEKKPDSSVLNISKISISNITSNSATISLDVTNWDFKNIIYLVIDDKKYDLYNLNDNTITFKLSNLKSDTFYDNYKIFVNEDLINVDKNTFKPFRTLKDSFQKEQGTVMVNSIVLSSLSENAAKIRINLSKNGFQKVDIKFNDIDNIVEFNIDNKNYIDIDLVNLVSNKKYTLEKLKIDNQEILLTNVFSFNTNLDRYYIDYLYFYNVTKSSAILKFRLNDSNNIDENNVSFTLSNNKEYKGLIKENNYFLFHIKNLEKNTTFSILNIKFGDKNIEISKKYKKEFTTKNDDLSDGEPSNNSGGRYDSRINETSKFIEFINEDRNIEISENFSDTFIKSKSEWQGYFNFINKPKVEHYNEDFEKTNQDNSSEKYARIIDVNIKNDLIEYDIEINDEESSSYSLRIEKNIDNTKKEEIINSQSLGNSKYRFIVNNLNSNVLVRAIELMKGANTKLGITNLTTTPYKVYDVHADSKGFIFEPTYNWELYSSSSNYYSIAFNVLLKDETTAWPTKFELEYFDNNFNIHSQLFTLQGRNTENRRKIEFYDLPKTKVNKILGISFTKNGKKYIITGINQINKPSEDLRDNNSNSLVVINSITKDDNFVTVNLVKSLPLNISHIDFRIKSLNPFEPYSKIMEANISSDRLSANIPIDLLPKNINNFIIVGSKVNNKIEKFGFQNRFKFSINNLESKNIRLEKIDFIKNEHNKRLFASARFNFEQEDFAFFKDKWFQFTFEPEVDEGSKEYYGFNFVTEYKINVPFEKIWKFGLNGFYENVQYKLKSVKVVDPYTLNSYFDNISISSAINNSFVYKFNYNENENKLISPEVEESIDYEDNSEFISRRKDLTFDDLINYWLSTSEKNKIPYSLQNHYALMEYEKFYFYKKVLTNGLKEKKKFIMVDDNGEHINYRFLAPREIIDKTFFNFNAERTEATLTKDLSEYKNLENHEESFFVLRLELDTKKRILSELSSIIQTESKNAKAFVQIAIPYKLLKEQGEIDSATFTFFQARGNRKIHQVLEKEIADKFKFNIKLDENNKMSIRILSKDNQTRLFDYLPDHYFSLENSAFIGNSTFFVHWIHKKESQDITFEGKPLKNNLSIDTDKLYIDSESNTDRSLFDKYIDFSKKDGTRRLFKQDSAPTINDIRKRTFTFGEYYGTWSVLGKVKPSDEEDHRFYVITNQHVWVDLNRSDISEDGNLTKYINDASLLVPILVDKPSNNETSVINPIYTSENKWRAKDIRFSLELITDFNTETSFPSPKDIKDGYGNTLDPKFEVEGRADMAIAILDLSFFYNNFKSKDENSWSYNGNELTEYEKSVVKFFLGWEKLSMVKASRMVLHLNESVNLNWYYGAYPYNASFNKDSSKTDIKRYREYLLGNIPSSIGRVSYLGSTVNNLAISYSTEFVDLGTGASGTSIYDSQGNIVGLHVQGGNAGANQPGFGSFFIVDGHKISFIGRGDTPQNQGSFYERMRLLSYLYPEKYDPINFAEVKKNYFD
ncbi:hypothetical protein [Mycoplasmopsis canis]|uniref:hypothetical protein n=1 Tax=Mycoplasmopsis canis TaxID=29555 RepID=UPI00025AFDF0|nr:hypothetical protein [Mycoplasmopsis canis]EIE40350.1 hypothetical protein MCANUF33_02541 [Mycoplasmopsis canis UF33]